MYVARSVANVDASDGTIAVRLYASVGTDKTIGYALSGKWKTVRNYKVHPLPHHKPLLVLDNIAYANRDANIRAIRTFITNNSITTLNICGHRETKVGGISLRVSVRDLFIEALNSVREYQN